MGILRPPLSGLQEEEKHEDFFYDSKELWNALTLASNVDGEASETRTSTPKCMTNLEAAGKILDMYRTKLSWPRNRTLEWLTDLYCFAHHITATSLMRYAEDALIGMLHVDTWIDLLTFSSSVDAPSLQEAAVQFGVRRLSPIV